MRRNVRRRTILPGIKSENYPHSIDLLLVAHAAAVETLQIDLVARGWASLFTALLDPAANRDDLVWAGKGPGGEAEVKRAYSALFGRFFGRAVLENEHDCLYMRQVRDGLDIGMGKTIQRRSGVGADGDLPDWVGWSASSGCVTVCEAKGSHDRGNWRTRRPQVLKNALDQIGRVEIVDAVGPVQSKGWAVASRWATTQNGVEPTIITEDPPINGRKLPFDEAVRMAEEMKALWLSDLLDGMGHSRLARAIRAQEDPDALSDRASLTNLAGKPSFAAALIDGAGIFTLNGARRRRRLANLINLAREDGRKLALVGIPHDVAQAALIRQPRPQDRELVRLDDHRAVIRNGVVLKW